MATMPGGNNHLLQWLHTFQWWWLHHLKIYHYHLRAEAHIHSGTTTFPSLTQTHLKPDLRTPDTFRPRGLILGFCDAWTLAGVQLRDGCWMAAHTWRKVACSMWCEVTTDLSPKMQASGLRFAYVNAGWSLGRRPAWRAHKPVRKTSSRWKKGVWRAAEYKGAIASDEST